MKALIYDDKVVDVKEQSYEVHSTMKCIDCPNNIRIGFFAEEYGSYQCFFVRDFYENVTQIKLIPFFFENIILSLVINKFYIFII